MANIELIYDQNVSAEKLKSGTKYERLTAIVYKILEASNIVIHDLRLRGNGKSASHQIDVTVQNGKTKKKILIECKQYESKIGIGIVRDFYGAVNQIKPDEAYVVTTTGFTKGAMMFASDEDIKLFILRDVNKDDLKGRILKINLRIIVPSYQFTIECFHIDDPAEIDKFEKLPQIHSQELVVEDLVIKNNQGDRVSSLSEETQKIVKANMGSTDKKITEKMIVNPNYIDFYGVKVNGVTISIDIKNEIIESQIGPKGIATLILQSVDNSSSKIIQDVDISRWAFSHKGEVVRK